MRLSALRLCTVLVCTALLVSCGATKKPGSVRKYCALTDLSFQNAQQMRVIHDQGIKLFKERKPYAKTDANRRVIAAATGLVTTAGVAAVQAEHPELFRGYAPGLSLGQVMAELITACRALPKDKK